jgi:DNA-binding beta-propeller fold protein YncE
VYVSETDPNNRAQEFSPSGDPIMLWGGGNLSSEPGKFNEPRSLTTDGRGNLYVLDAGNNRIQEFSPEDRLLALWSGPKANFFRDSSAMAMDPSGNVYVSAGASIIKTCLSSAGCS